MFRTALRNVLAHKARLMMTVLAVLLGVAFVSGTLVFSDTIGTAFKSASASSLKDVAVSVQSDEFNDDGTTSVDGELVDRIRAIDGVTSVRPSVTGLTTVADKDDKPLGGDWGGEGTNYVPGSDGKDSRYPVEQGRGPTGPGEVALDARSAERGGFKVGDTLRIVVDGPVLKKKLVGIVGTDDPRVGVGGSLALFDTATAQKLFLATGYFDELVVGAAPGTDQVALTARVRDALPEEGATAQSGKALAAAESKRITEDTKSFSQMLLVFAGIALFVGVFIIANTFTMLVAQRTRELALLRAVGASRRQVTRSVLVEAALLGLVASAAGFVLGIGIAVGLRAGLNAAGAGFPDGPLVVGTSAVGWSLAVGVVVTVAAAWLPSRRAAKIAPVEAMSSVDQAPTTRGLRLRNSIGAVLTALGAAVMVMVSSMDASDGVYVAMVGAMLMMVGCIVLSPALSRPLVTVMGKVFTRMFGIAGKLAQENAIRNPRRTAATASALMIGLTLITGLTVAAHSVQGAMDRMALQDFDADYQVSMSGVSVLTPEMGEQIADVPGVAAAVPIHTAGAEAGEGNYFTVSGTDLASIGQVTDLTFVSGTVDDLGGDRIAVSESTARATGWQVGDTAELGFYTEDGDEKDQLTVGAVYRDNEIVPDVLAATTVVDPHLSPVGSDKVLVKADSGQSAGLDKRIREALGGNPVIKVQDPEALRSDEAGDINLALNMVYGLLGMAVVIAVVGVVNTLAMSVFERTREIGMLRAIGLSRTGVRQMVRLESVVISLFGAVLGIGLGTFVAWASGRMFRTEFPAYSLAVPWDRIGLFLLIALVVGVLAAVWPARRAAGLNTLQAISAQ